MIIQTIHRFFQYTDIDTDINARDNTLWMFVGGVLGYCLLTYLVFGYELFSGEMSNDTIIVYFNHVNGSLNQFLRTDAGYLVWPQQIIAWIGYVLIIPSKYIPYFYGGTATFINAMMIFLFCLPRFRCLIPSDIFRLILCIAIACISNIGVREFINVPYNAVFLIMVICAMMMVAKPDKMPWYVKIMPIFFVSKPAIMGLIPVLIFTLFYTNKNSRVVIGLCFIGIIIQLLNSYSPFYIKEPQYGVLGLFPIFMLSLFYTNKNFQIIAGLYLIATIIYIAETHSFVTAPISPEHIPFIDRFTIFINQVSFQISALWQVQFTLKMPIFAKYILTIGTIASLLYVCFTWKHPAKLLIIFGTVAMICVNFIISFSLPVGYFEQWENTRLSIYRWTVIQFFGIFMIAGALCLYFSEKIGKPHHWYGKASVLFIIWLTASSWGYKLYDTNKIPATIFQPIAWQNNHDEGVFKKVCTFARPFHMYNPRIYCLGFGKKYINPNQTPVLPNTPVNLFKPVELGNQNVSSIIAFYHVPADHSGYQLTLQVNDQIITKTIKPTSHLAKNMAVQFNLPTWINAEDITEVSLKSSIVIYVSTDKNHPDEADARWHVQ